MKSIPQLKKDFISTMNKLSYTRHKWQVWQDFTEMAALSISQSVNYTDAREAQYMRVVGRYEPEEVQLIPQLLGITTAALELQMYEEAIDYLNKTDVLDIHFARDYILNIPSEEAIRRANKMKNFIDILRH